MQDTLAAPLEQHVWWDAAEAVTFLREGIVPSEVNWRRLPDAIAETRTLNAAIQAGKIDMIEVLLDDSRHRLKAEDKALIELRFHESWLGGGIGVVLHIVDKHTGERQRGIKNLLLRPDDVRALRQPLKSGSSWNRVGEFRV